MNGTHRLRPDVVATVLESGAVLLDLRTRYFYSANAAAWSILQMFESGTSAAEVERQYAAAAGDRFDAAALKALLDMLIADDLVEATGNGASAETINPPATWDPPTLTRHKEPLQRIMVSAFDPSIPLAE